MKIWQKIVLICFSALVISITFYINFKNRIQTFESEAKSREADVNEYIELSSTFIDLMTIYGDRYLETGGAPDSEILSLLQYNAEQNSYNLDAVGGTKYETTTGNITGSGSIPGSGTYRDEINLALEYNRYFSSFMDRMPEVTWLYYTSENNFINMYPWISSGEFSYSEKLKHVAFFDIATPRNNSLRQAVWTPVYLDEAGQGLMVTLSSPIYQNDTFRGVVSLDLTTKHLGELISFDYTSCLVDDYDFVIAASLNAMFSQKKTTFDALLDLSPSEAQTVKDMQAGLVQAVGSNYIYRVDFSNAPWCAYFSMPVWIVVGLAALYTLPILACCILLFLAFAESEKRRKTQVALADSLAEVRSYHNLLENAAKHDFLTDTCNRRGLAEIFREFVETNGTKNMPVAFIMGDIDEFKHFNDTFGHTAGDRVLIEIAKIMKESITERDVICRWGGEEFVLMLLNTSFEDAMQIAEVIRKRIENNTLPWANSMELHATMTFGVVAYDGTEDMQVCISRADSAMYAGKQKGRNRVVGHQG